jgi:DNA-binding response OmpR family regulator
VDNILICTSDPIFVKSLYAYLREQGYGVETTDQTARAVQRVLESRYAAVILDAEGVGLSAGEAVRIMNSVAAEMPVIIAGPPYSPQGAVTIGKPVDLEELGQAIRAIVEPQL